MTDEQPTCWYCEQQPAVTVKTPVGTAGGGGGGGGGGGILHLHRGAFAAKPACEQCLIDGRHLTRHNPKDAPPQRGGGHYMEGT